MFDSEFPADTLGGTGLSREDFVNTIRTVNGFFEEAEAFPWSLFFQASSASARAVIGGDRAVIGQC